LSSYSPLTHPPTTDLYTLSLHDALPIYVPDAPPSGPVRQERRELAEHPGSDRRQAAQRAHRRSHADVPEAIHAIRELHRRCGVRSEEHTSELQSRGHLVCRLLLEKKKHT